ncbi:MAG TPA: hypothetical protein VFA61_10525 [Candidatus Udaeobacter sp.]|nr:hypothetical protein [Candidatus Udaeobacter sp.]
MSRKTLTEARDVQQPFRERTPLACWRLRMLSRVANFAAMPQLALSFKGNKVCSGKMRQPVRWKRALPQDCAVSASFRWEATSRASGQR